MPTYTAPGPATGGAGVLYQGRDVSKDADAIVLYQLESELGTFSAATATVDEDFVTLRVQAQPANVVLAVAEQNEQTGLRTDEDYFENPIIKTLASNTTLPLWILDWQYDQHESIFLATDEDFQAAQIHCEATNTAPLQFGFDQSETFPRYDEDLFQVAVPPAQATANRTPAQWLLDLQFDQHEPLVRFDEDYFQVAAPRAISANTAQYSYQQDEVTVQPLPVDEAYWQNAAAPVTIPNATLVQWIAEEFFPAHVVLGQPDEDYWQNQVAAASIPNAVPSPYAFETNDPSGPLFGQADEDFWQNPTPAVSIPNRAPSQHSFDQHEPGNLFANIDEMFWSNPVFAATIPNIAPQQATFDQNDLGSMHVPVDEDFWQNQTAPITYPNRLLFGWVHEQGEEATMLFGQFAPDEYFPLPQPQPGALAWPSPWAGSEDVPTVFQAYEDYSITLTAPTPATIYQPLPIAFDETPIVLQPVYGGVEEYMVPQPQSVAVLPVVPTWPWAFSSSEDEFKFTVIAGRVWITFIR